MIKKIVSLPWLWFIAITVFYWSSRLINLTTLPIFTDEAIYIRWAQIGSQDASWRFISLTDGKQPLFTWFMMAAMRYIQDPLVAGRFTSVLSGFVGMIGMFFLGTELFKQKRIGIIASILYLICPFTLFYDRIALYDSLVSAFSIWNLYLTILLARYNRLDIALILGLTLGAGMLNKTSAFISLYLLPISLLLFHWNKKQLLTRFFRFIGFMIVSAGLSQLVYSVLRLSPYFYIIAQKDTIFVYPFSMWIRHPTEFFFGNIKGMFDWLIGYVSLPLCISAWVSLGFVKKDIREKIFLILWWLLPFSALALFGRVLYPRHMLFMVLPLLLLAAWFIHMLIEKIRSRQIVIFVILFLLSLNMYSSYTIITDIKNAYIPKSERNQYIDDWPSGWGIKEIVQFVSAKALEGRVSIYTEGTFGLLPYAFEIYLVTNTNIDIHGIWPTPGVMPDEIYKSALDHPTYYVMYQNQERPIQWRLELVAEYQKGLNKKSTMRLYKILP